jgi:hypothetical protein
MALASFSPRSIWRTALADNAPLVTGGSSQVQGLINQIRSSKTPQSSPIWSAFFNPPFTTALSQSSYGIPVWVVPTGQATQKVQLIVNGIPQTNSHPLQAAWNNVPLPTGISQLEANGSDGSCVVWRPSTDELWEFWHFIDDNTGITPNGPSAVWGGYIEKVSEHPGYYVGTPETNNLSWGVRAAGFSALGGLIRVDEVNAGLIPHALVCSLGLTLNTLAPAQRSDSSISPTNLGFFGPSTLSILDANAVSEGALFRFPPGATPSNLTTIQAILYNAIRDYGMYIGDTGDCMSIYAEDTRTFGTGYTDSTAQVNATMPISADIYALPWESIEQVAWTNSVPTGKKLCHYQGSVALITAY